MQYLLRDIDPQLWKRAKIYAATNETSLRSLLLAGLEKQIMKDKKKTIWQIGGTVFSSDESMCSGDFARVHSFRAINAAEQLCGFSEQGFILEWADRL